MTEQRRPMRRSTEPTFAELEAGLSINKDNLDEEARQHTNLFYHVAKQLVLEISKRDQLYQRCKEVEAETDVNLRDEAAQREERITDKTVEALVRTADAVVHARTQLAEANLLVGQLQALKEAYMSRQYMLRDLTSLYLGNYFGGDMDRRSQNAYTAQQAQREERARRRGE